MPDRYSDFDALVRSNLRRIRTLRGLTHGQVSEKLSELTGCRPGHTQSQSNERAHALPWRRLAALADIFGVHPSEFLMDPMPTLEAEQIAREASNES